MTWSLQGSWSLGVQAGQGRSETQATGWGNQREHRFSSATPKHLRLWVSEQRRLTVCVKICEAGRALGFASLLLPLYHFLKCQEIKEEINNCLFHVSSIWIIELMRSVLHSFSLQLCGRIMNKSCTYWQTMTWFLNECICYKIVTLR